MSELPKDVVELKHALSRDPSNDLYEIAEKLIDETPELAAMWRALEKRKVGEDNLWVWSFLDVAKSASTLPPFHHKSVKDRQQLAGRITKLAKQLAHELEENFLDVHLIHEDGKIFNGFYFYEDFGFSNQASIDVEHGSKLQISRLILQASDRAAKIIIEEPEPGKTGINAPAIRFIRIIAERNERLYGQPLRSVTAIAANTIFGTSYQEGDIANLLNR